MVLATMPDLWALLKLDGNGSGNAWINMSRIIPGLGATAGWNDVGDFQRLIPGVENFEKHG